MLNLTEFHYLPPSAYVRRAESCFTEACGGTPGNPFHGHEPHHEEEPHVSETYSMAGVTPSISLPASRVMRSPWPMDSTYLEPDQISEFSLHFAMPVGRVVPRWVDTARAERTLHDQRARIVLSNHRWSR